MKKLLKSVFEIFAGRKAFQPLFQGLYKIGLYGMNIGGSSDIDKNGELNALHYIKDHLPENPIVFDVGANVGNYIAVILAYFDKAEIHAFEPLEINFNRLKDRFEKHTSIRLNQMGLGDQEMEIPIYYNPELGALASVYNRRLTHHHLSLKESEKIKIGTLEQYCKKNKIDHIDYLKLDIEGHELAALKGSLTMIEQHKIKFIQFEFGGTNIDSKTYFQDFWYLMSPSYHIYRILKNGLQEVKSYDESKEIFSYINYLAKLK